VLPSVGAIANRQRGTTGIPPGNRVPAHTVRLRLMTQQEKTQIQSAAERGRRMAAELADWKDDHD
jgi:hypothetical protein